MLTGVSTVLARVVTGEMTVFAIFLFSFLATDAFWECLVSVVSELGKVSVGSEAYPVGWLNLFAQCKLVRLFTFTVSQPSLSSLAVGGLESAFCRCVRDPTRLDLEAETSSELALSVELELATSSRESCLKRGWTDARLFLFGRSIIVLERAANRPAGEVGVAAYGVTAFLWACN